jgi:polyferredoxin
VQVCPTGIDIRNGTQLECINCTACIDECNDVMQKVHQPEGLIRYASQEEIATGKVKRVTPRSVAYMIILTVLVGVLSFLLLTRKEVDSTVLRTPGMLHQVQADGSISNMYNFEVVNKTFDTKQIELKVKSPDGAVLKMVDRDASAFTLDEDQLVKGSFFIKIPPSEIKQNNTKTIIEVYSGGKLMHTIESNFVGPIN